MKDSHDLHIYNFDEPTQVKWRNLGEDSWFGGIGVGRYIICGHCGALIDLASAYTTGIMLEIEPLGDWIDISNEIIGE